MTIAVNSRAARRLRRAARLAFWLSLLGFMLGVVGGSHGAAWGWLVAAAFAAGAVAATGLYLGALMIGQAQAGRELAASLAGDPGTARPVVLFLRSFDAAESKLIYRAGMALAFLVEAAGAASGGSSSAISDRYDAEEELDGALGGKAIFVAIGDKRTSYGAAKMLVQDAQWQGTFHRLAEAAVAIFMLPGPSPAVLWELAQIRAAPDLLAKTIFIMPRESARKSWGALAAAAHDTGVTLPLYRSEGCYFRLTDDGQVGDIKALEPFTRRLRRYIDGLADPRTFDVAETWKDA